MKKIFILISLILTFSNSQADEKLSSSFISNDVWSNPNLRRETVQFFLDENLKAAETIPPNASKDTEDGYRLILLKNRIELFKEFLQVFDRISYLSSEKDDESLEYKDLIKKIEKQKNLPKITEPKNPNPEEFKSVKEKFETQAYVFEEIKTQINKRRQFMSQIPTLIIQTKERQNASEKQAKKLIDALSESPDAKSNKNLNIQIDNSRLEYRIATSLLKLYEYEQAYEKKMAPFYDKKYDLEHLKIERYEQTFLIYQSALKKYQESILISKTEDLEKKTQALSSAKNEADKFIADLEAEIAKINLNIADLNKFKTEVAKEVNEQEKQLKNEKNELNNLETLIKQIGTDGYAAKILKSTYKHIGEKRRALKKSIKPEIIEKINSSRTKMYELDSFIYEIREIFDKNLSIAIKSVSLSQKDLFKLKAEKLYFNYRELFSSEKTLLFEIINEGQKLEIYPIERVNVLQNFEKFVISNVFWIRDEEPLSYKLLLKAIDEIFSPERSNSFINWWKNFISLDIKNSLKKPIAVFYCLILMYIFPVIIFYSIVNLRFLLLKPKKNIIKNRTVICIYGISLSAFLFFYFLSASYMVDVLNIPPAIENVITNFFILFGLFVFVWYLNRFLFKNRGFYNIYTAVPNKIIKTLYKAILFANFSYFFFLIPWDIFRKEPFDFDITPRIEYILFEVCSIISVFLVMQKSSLILKYFFKLSSDKTFIPALFVKYDLNFFIKHIKFINTIIIFFMMLVMILDMMGYHFGAMQLYKNSSFTLLTIFGGLTLYSNLITILDKLIQKNEGYLEVQTQKFIYIFFVIIGILLITGIWGLNKQAFQTLNEQTLFKISSVEGKLEFVSIADLFKFIFIIIATIWILKHLKQIYNFFFFSKFNWDEGSQYAILTISRYSLFILGLFISLSAIHLDVGRIGWLVAAISVGIGFGLQEIVANFICGIIILIERPIRIGDRISVGNITGDVTQINIRATTVRNFDKQEILVPNRDLITKEVINWTLENSITRLIVEIGVAYGTDIDKVKNILMSIVKKRIEILKDPEPEVFFIKHGASSLDFNIHVYLPNPGLRLKIQDRLNTLINKEFKANNINIPFPQREIRIIGKE